jgi:hypothetical protein
MSDRLIDGYLCVYLVYFYPLIKTLSYTEAVPTTYSVFYFY